MRLNSSILDRRALCQLPTIVLMVCLTGCAAAPRNISAVHAYYRYDFTTSREALRADAMTRNDEQVLLNNARLGIASLADGDVVEAELALGRSFDLLSTAGLNRDRTTAAVWVHEGVRIWKGEPFEQAMMYHYVAALYAVMGDWENARAAAANALFRLTDFGGYQTSESLARQAARDPAYLDKGYNAVETDFALGFLMQAIGADRSGAPGRDDLLDAAVQIDPSLRTLAEVLRSRDYDTLLIVDYGKGPTKIAYGPDNALVRFDSQERHPHGRPMLEVRSSHGLNLTAAAVADIDRMARDHRWNNLEDVRKAKSAIGNVLLMGGAATTAIGAQHRSAEAALAGVGLMVIGALAKSGAQADARYMELLPHSVYLVPLKLGRETNLHVSVPASPGSAIVLPGFQPGTTEAPRAVYLRLHGRGSAAPAWLAASSPVFGNDATGVRHGDYPWILGGNDVSTPSRAVLEAYQAGGRMLDFTVSDLVALYEAEGINIGSGMENRPGVLRNPSFRHILEGGTGLFTPEPDSPGYKRIMFTPRSPYVPRSELVRNAAERIRVKE